MVDEYDVAIPTAGSAVEARDVQATVARRLFGDGAVNRGGTVLPEYVKTVCCFVQRRYESLYRQLNTLKRRSKTQRDDVDCKLEGKLSLSNIPQTLTWCLSYSGSSAANTGGAPGCVPSIAKMAEDCTRDTGG
jgi:hypothetical protein